MVERKEVEALYQEARESGGSIGHVDSSHLAALCRAWLAVQDAPEVEVTACNQVEGAADFDHGDMAAAVAGLTPGQRVRIVPVEGDQ